METLHPTDLAALEIFSRLGGRWRNVDPDAPAADGDAIRALVGIGLAEARMSVAATIDGSSDGVEYHLRIRGGCSTEDIHAAIGRHFPQTWLDDRGRTRTRVHLQHSGYTAARLTVAGQQQAQKGEPWRTLALVHRYARGEAAAVDVLVESSKPLKAENAEQPATWATRRTARVSAAEYNVRAREALKNKKCQTLRTLMQAIGCPSKRTAEKLPAWVAFNELRKQRRPQGRTKKAAYLSPAVTARAATIDSDEALHHLLDDDDRQAEIDRLAKEQAADDDDRHCHRLVRHKTV